ncbi:DinB family protein [Streptomyces sp. NPDC051109]|uniref:DinB family protein n=1 Tax=Streptomyces sp. NPDC051109 TaxID=3365642 RepID=UPI0037BD2BDF
MSGEPLVDRQLIHDELDRARVEFHQLLDAAKPADLSLPTRGTRWTNEQLLFHMLFGYILIRPLLALMRIFGQLPHGVSRAFSRLLNSATRPFDVINYLGPVAAVRVYGHRRMGAKLDGVIAGLHRHLDAAPEAAFTLGMHYPVRWDPFFRDFMTVTDLYHYPAQHFDFHHRQLTLTDTC